MCVIQSLHVLSVIGACDIAVTSTGYELRSHTPLSCINKPIENLTSDSIKRVFIQPEI
jgi:hypothetical protein